MIEKKSVEDFLRDQVFYSSFVFFIPNLFEYSFLFKAIEAVWPVKIQY